MVLFSTLFLTYLAVVFNKTLYVFTQNSKNHFVYNYHVAKELANWLKQNGYALVHVDNPNLAQRLAFYGIVEGGEYELVNVKGESVQKGDFVLKYHDKSVAHYRIYKLYDLN